MVPPRFLRRDCQKMLIARSMLRFVVSTVHKRTLRAASSLLLDNSSSLKSTSCFFSPTPTFCQRLLLTQHSRALTRCPDSLAEYVLLLFCFLIHYCSFPSQTQQDSTLRLPIFARLASNQQQNMSYPFKVQQEREPCFASCMCMGSLSFFPSLALSPSLGCKLLFRAIRAGAAEVKASSARRNQVPSNHTPGGINWVAVRAKGRGGRPSDRRSAAVAQPLEDNDSPKCV